MSLLSRDTRGADDLEDHWKRNIRMKDVSRSRYRIYTALGLLCGAFLFGLMIVMPRMKGSHVNAFDFSPRGPTSCGPNPQEAQRLGCQFDLMQYSWVPSACFDAELTAEYVAMLEKRKLFHYFKPHEDTVENTIPRAELIQGEHELVYMNWEQHREHCAFMFRKLHRAMEAGGPIDSYIGEYHHTKHCLIILMETETDLKYLDTRTTMKYPRCE